MAVGPRGADLKRFLQEDPRGPVLLLNQLRYAEGGRELYGRYAAALTDAFLPRYGGEVLDAAYRPTATVAASSRQAARSAADGGPVRLSGAATCFQRSAPVIFWMAARAPAVSSPPCT